MPLCSLLRHHKYKYKMDNVNTIDKDSEKYIVILKLINKILTNINKEHIDDLLKFSYIYI